MSFLLFARRAWVALAWVVLVPLLGACSHKSVQGVWFPESQVLNVKPGIDNKQRVLETLGAPNVLNPYREHVFYYYGARTSKVGRFAPHLSDRQIVILRFDPETEILQEMELRDIDKVARVKSSAGKTRVLSTKTNVLDEIFGNVGSITTGAGG